MAQIKASTASVTPAIGDAWENLPLNPQKVLQAYKATAQINTEDPILYPCIKFLVDYSFKVDNTKKLNADNIQIWFYASGDTATRDLDFADADGKIGEAGGGGGSGPIDVIIAASQLNPAGALRVSQSIITGNYVQSRDDLPLLFDRKGTGTQVYSDGHVTMTVGVGEYALCQSKAFSPYLAGKPTDVRLTFDGFSQKANVSQKTGFGSRSIIAPYIADFDGFYFEADGTNYQIVTRNSATGIKKTVVQGDWNDSLDGSGASGVTADFSKFTVLEFDFLWLGGTGLRSYINIGGELILFNTIPWSNSNADTIFRSPFQPVFYEIRSTTGTGSFNQICASTEVQGTLDLIGSQRSVNNLGNSIRANAPNVIYLLKAIRLKSANRDAFVQINGFTTLATTNDNFLYLVILNPTINPVGLPLTWIGLTNSVIESADGDTVNSPSVTTVTGGTVLDSGYSNANAALQGAFKSITRLGGTIDAVMDIVAICAMPLTSNLRILGSANTIEI